MLLRIARRAAPWVALACAFALLCVFEWRNVGDLLDSDMGSDMIYANLLFKEGRLLSPSWYYSTELRILHNHLFFTPLFYLTQDWRLVRFLGSVISYVLFLVSLGCLTRQLGLKRFFPLLGAALLLPLSEVYFHYTFISTFYTPYLILSFFLFALALSQSAPLPPRARAVRLAALGVLSLLTGLSGFRFVISSALPLTLAAVVLRLRHPGHARSGRLLTGSLVCLGTMLAGVAVNLFVLSRIYTFASYSGMHFTAFSFERVGEFFTGLLALLGYPAGKPVFSLAPAAAILSLVVPGLGVWSVARVLRAPRGAVDAPAPSFGEQFLALFVMLGTALFLCLAALTDMELYHYHFLPIAIYLAPLAAMRLQSLRLPSLRIAAAGGLAVLLGAVCLVNYPYYTRRDMTYEQRMLLETLSEEGYSTGYSTFWMGNVLTELSGGEVDMYVIKRPLNTAQDLLDRVDAWLQLKSHREAPPEGKVFILFSKWYGETDFPLYACLSSGHTLFESPNFIALGYDSFDALYADAQSGPDT